MASKGDTVIVPVGQTAFNKALEDGLYAFPRSRNFDNELQYIAFYRTEPESAITHYSTIGSYVEEAEELVSLKEKLLMFKEPGPASAFELSEVKDLDRPVVRDGNNAIQSMKYADLERIKEADVLSRL